MEVNRPSTKQLLNNFWGEGQKWIVYKKKKCNLEPGLENIASFLRNFHTEIGKIPNSRDIAVRKILTYIAVSNILPQSVHICHALYGLFLYK